jgi:iron complex transport system substrate-binding protein
MHGPQRIVSLLASATEILACLGLLDRLKAISHECDYPPGVADRPRVTRSTLSPSLSSQEIDDAVRRQLGAGEPLYQLDADEICRIGPDLIITQAQCDVCAVRYQDVVSLLESNPSLTTVVLPLNPSTLEEILADIVQVGTATGCTEEAEQLVSRLEERMLAIQQQVMGKPKPRVACIEWTEPMMLAGNWVPDLISMAGGESLLADAGTESVYWSWQEVVELDPEVIVIAPCGFDLERSRHEARGLPGWEHWGELTAVRQKRVFVVDGNALLNRSGPRVVDTIEILAHLFHPHDVAAPGGNYGRGKGWEMLGEST